MRWTKLTGLEDDFESDVTSSTVTYPLPLQKSGQINGAVKNMDADNQDNTLGKGGQDGVVRTEHPS